MGEKEDLGHFVLRCEKLEWVRNRGLFTEGTEVDRLGRLLFEKENIEEVKRMLGRMWKEREFQKKRYMNLEKKEKELKRVNHSEKWEK